MKLNNLKLRFDSKRWVFECFKSYDSRICKKVIFFKFILINLKNESFVSVKLVKNIVVLILAVTLQHNEIDMS
jgi:hypothetical protein